MKRILIIGGILVLILNSCRNDFPSFPLAYIPWIPYEIYDTIKFTDGSEIIKFSIDELIGSHVQDLPYTPKPTSKDAFIESFGAITSTNEKLNLKISFFILGGQYSISFIYSSDEEDSFYTYIPNIKPSGDIDSLEINSHWYYNVVIPEYNSHGDTLRVSKIVLVKNYGLVQFIDKGVEWNLISDD